MKPKEAPVTDEELREWLWDIKRRGTVRAWEPHVELRMRRIFARLRELELGPIVDVIELYVQHVREAHFREFQTRSEYRR